MENNVVITSDNILLSEKRAAEYLNSSLYAFRQEVKKGTIAFKIQGKRKKYPVKELERWLNDTQTLIVYTKEARYGTPTSRTKVYSLDALVAQRAAEKQNSLLLKKCRRLKSNQHLDMET